MSLPKPVLDDRRFQDIVDEAKLRISELSPQWTDHNVSDPGITLIELFAWMTEMILYRLNQVPEKNYLTFLELLGVRLAPPQPARAPLTFRLTAPLGQDNERMVIPKNTEVMARQTDASQEPIIFSTDEDLEIRPPSAPTILRATANDTIVEVYPTPKPFQPFSDKPQPGEWFAIGVQPQISGHVLLITLECERGKGSGVAPDDPPLVWEAWCAGRWLPVVVERDTTSVLNETGEVGLRLPSTMSEHAAYIQQNYPGYWVRCVYQPEPIQKKYEQSPHILGVRLRTSGATVMASHAVTIVGEEIGRSDGLSEQHFTLNYRPVLPFRAPRYDKNGALIDSGDCVEIEPAHDDMPWERWLQPAEHDFGRSRDERHFLIDCASGTISFGPQVREPDGTLVHYGAIPERGRRIRVNQYRVGGGIIGNVPARKLTELRRTISYVREVCNYAPATGGRDGEMIEHAKLRAPQLLRTGGRAVTVDDYIYFARQAHPDITRVHCLHPSAVTDPNKPPPGTVIVLLIPAAPQEERQPIRSEQLVVESRVRDQVKAYLDERRLLATQLEVEEPTYVRVAVHARLKSRLGSNRDAVRREAEIRLYRFLSPLTGGNMTGAIGSGWPFDRNLYISDVIGILQSIPDVDYIDWLYFKIEDQAESQGPIEITGKQMIASDTHVIRIS